MSFLLYVLKREVKFICVIEKWIFANFTVINPVSKDQSMDIKKEDLHCTRDL